MGDAMSNPRYAPGTLVWFVRPHLDQVVKFVRPSDGEGECTLTLRGKARPMLVLRQRHRGEVSFDLLYGTTQEPKGEKRKICFEIMKGKKSFIFYDQLFCYSEKLIYHEEEKRVLSEEEFNVLWERIPEYIKLRLPKKEKLLTDRNMGVFGTLNDNLSTSCFSPPQK